MRQVGLVIGVLVGSTLPCVYFLPVIWPSVQFSREKRAIEQLLHQWWEGRPPPGVSERRWEGAWGIAYNGFGNVCFSPEHVSLQEMHLLKADLQAKMQEPATMASLRWFWNRLAETGPHGAQYIEQMTPLLDNAIGEPAAAGPLGG